MGPQANRPVSSLDGRWRRRTAPLNVFPSTVEPDWHRRRRIAACPRSGRDWAKTDQPTCPCADGHVMRPLYFAHRRIRFSRQIPMSATSSNSGTAPAPQPRACPAGIGRYASKRGLGVVIVSSPALFDLAFRAFCITSSPLHRTDRQTNVSACRYQPTTTRYAHRGPSSLGFEEPR